MLNIKEANRVFFAVKGGLIPKEYTYYDIKTMYASYIKRLWGNHEAFSRDDLFEKAWAKRHLTSDPEDDYPDFINGDYFD